MNKKGFTLIELLAVIVLLGLVLVVTVPSVIGSVNNSKISSLHTMAKEYAKWYDKVSVEDKLSNSVEDKLSNGSKLNKATEDWSCIKSIDTKNIYGLSEDDIALEGSISDLNNINSGTCSAIRLVNGKAEVLLVAKKDGKFDANGANITYALSSASKGNANE